MNPTRIPLWIDLRAVPINKRLPYLHAVRDVGAERVLLAKDDAHHAREGLVTLTVDGNNRLLEGKRAIGRIAKVSDGKAQAKAAKDKGVIVVEAAPDRIIPLENLIAARQDRPGTLFARATTLADARLCATVLEQGVHGVVLAPSSPQDIHATHRALVELGHSRLPPASTATTAATATAATAATAANGESAANTAGTATATFAPSPLPEPVAQSGFPGRTHDAQANGVPAAPAPPPTPTAVGTRVKLQPAEVTRIDDGGLGDRVCIDTTSLLADGEGLLVGSMAHSLAIVHAETSPSAFIAARPFRVNAGAVHSYVLGAAGRTSYIAELAAGSTVLVVHRSGTTRTVTVGRVKVERRPHLILHWQTAAGPASVALQNAETVRLVRPDGSATPVTELRKGDFILVHDGHPARHAGIPVDEHVEER